MCWVVGGLSLTLAVLFLARVYSTFPGDRGVLERVQDNQWGWLYAAAQTVSIIGDWPVAATLIAGLAACLALARRRGDAIIVLISAVPMLSVFLLKELVGRSRPEYFGAGAEPTTMSFPSGHAVFAIIFGGLLIFLSERLVRQLGVRRAIQVSAGVLIAAIGASRVYLGVHWPSDVWGGYLLGGMALLGLLWLRNRIALGHSAPSQVGR